MKIHRHLLPVLLSALLSAVISGCASQTKPEAISPPAAATPTALQQPAAGSVDSETVLDMVQRLNSGDVDGSLNYFAEDAVTYFVGMPPTGMEIYKGREALRPTWEDCANSHFKWEVSVVSSEGGIVTATTKTWHDFTRQLGVAPNEFLDVFVLKDGRITEYASTLTEASLAKFKPALAKVMPPAEPATPSQDEPGSEMKFTTTAGTCNYEGPMTLKQGEIKVRWDVKDTNKQKYALTIHTLAAGKDSIDLMAATIGSPPSWAVMPFYEEQEGGSSGTYVLPVKEGPLYAICWSGAPDMAIGLVGPFEVAAPTAGPAPTPEPIGREMKFTTVGGRCEYEGPVVVQAGEVQIEWAVEDLQKDNYALTLFNLSPGKTLGDLMASTSQASPPSWADMIFYEEQLPGANESYSLNVEKGPLYVVCWSSPPDRAIRGIGPLEVRP